MFLPMLGPGNDLLFAGDLTVGVQAAGGGGVSEMHGLDTDPTLVVNSAIGSATGKTASDGSGYILHTLVTAFIAGQYYTYVNLNMPTGGSETQNSVWGSLVINGNTLTAAAATSYSHNGTYGSWYFELNNTLGLFTVPAATVLPYRFTRA
jgi:hypothetical protein